MIPPDIAPTAPPDDPLRHQPRLRGLAYRMLGDLDDAEEVVQDAYLRWHRADRSDVRSSEAWLVTAVSRLAVDRLRRRATERAAYVGPWLPAPVATDAIPSPARDAELASDLSVALLLLLERLAPEERAAFLLREVFDTGYDEIARILARSEPAVRQVVHRARRRVRAERPRFAASREEHAELLERFVAALAAEDAAGVVALLAPDVTLTSDGGGKVTAARRRLDGAHRVVRLLVGVAAKGRGRVSYRPTVLNGRPGYLTFVDGRLFAATSAAMDGDRIAALYIVLNPDKLRHVTGGVPPLA
jgi:RNA polymerase sigma-70 factor (ECF subfamily)